MALRSDSIRDLPTDGVIWLDRESGCEVTIPHGNLDLISLIDVICSRKYLILSARVGVADRNLLVGCE